MSDTQAPLGIIAGSRSLPLELARQARAQGVRRLAAVAFEGETDPQIAELVDEVCWLKVGQLDRMIRFFVDRDIRRCVMAGQIAPRNLFDLRPDFRAMKLLFGLKEKNAHSIFGGIGEELAKDGVRLVEATPWLRPLMPGVGFSLGRPLRSEEIADVAYGMGIAKEVSRLDIGQTVVVKGGTVLAVEGFEGTDACLERGGKLAGKDGGAVAVKVAKPSHDMRFDIPCLGVTTLECCARSGIGVLAFEPDKTLLLERPRVEAFLKTRPMALVTQA
ncbi:MAG: LpxI family protein [Verrucomicrobia bacterium]|nr:LpxI family protein [Verrucomicrobiota bacterium]MBI3870676.1 LpxI family protein [Verrucomicrobiota bacterium]